MNSVWAPLATVLVAIMGGLGAWLAAKRKGSGTVRTSEATELWTANTEFRNMLMEEARARTSENIALRKEAEECHKIQAEQDKRITTLEREITRLKQLAGET